MRPNYFMEDDVLMVSIQCDPSSVVTRPATDDEKADYEEAQQQADAKAAEAEKAEAKKAAK